MSTSPISPISPAAPVIQLSGLVKRFGSQRALDGVSAQIPAGAVGLLGPNGAGKTTLIKLLLGLLIPDEGSARIAGLDPSTRAARLSIRKVVGYMPEGDCLLPGMTGVELVSTLGRITGLSKQDAMTRAHEVLDYVELEEERYRKLDEYSTGMKQRLKLAQTLVHDPSLLLLDEPTNGLDPKGRRHMLELVTDLGHAQGKNILLCSHLLPDVEQTCDHVIVLDRGRMCRTGEIGAMTASDGLTYSVTFGESWPEWVPQLRERGFDLQGEGPQFRLQMQAGDKDADQLFTLVAQTGGSITALTGVRSSLQDVFLEALGLPSGIDTGAKAPLAQP